MADLSKPIAQLSSVAFVVMAMTYSVVHIWPSNPDAQPALPGQVDPTLFTDAQVLPSIPNEKFISSDPIANDEASREVVEQIKAAWPDDHRRAFLIAIAPHALQSAVDNCVPPSITLAQAVLESGWGRSGLAARHKNLFGMKSGAHSNGIALNTREVVEGKSTSQKARFRTFQDWSQSIAAHGSLIDQDPRYDAAQAQWEHWPLFLSTLAPIYATDPQYVDHISSLVENYHLDRWDRLVIDAASRRSDCPQWNAEGVQGSNAEPLLISTQ